MAPSRPHSSRPGISPFRRVLRGGLRPAARAAGPLAAGLLAAIGPRPAAAQCQLQRLGAAVPVASDQHGDAVAASGDWLVVGASRADEAFVSQGEATVYRLEDGLWVVEQTLRAADGQANDLFGWSVDVDAFAADGPVIVAGAYLHDAAASNAGAAYVFRYDPARPAGQRWQQEQKLQLAGALAGDEFGEAVAVSGDLLAVGVARRDDAGSNAGAIALFDFGGTSWTQQPDLLLPTDLADGDRFGSSVDVVADAIGGALVVGGAPLADVDGLVNAGAVWVFREKGGAWIEAPRLDAGADAGEGDRLGESVAAATTPDGDVVATGAWLDDDVASNAGSVVVFRGPLAPSGAWSLEAILFAAPADVNADDQLGRAVAIDPAGTKIAAGAALADDEGASSGAVVVYEDIGGGTWDRVGRLVALSAEPGDEAGTSVAIEGALAFAGARGADGAGGQAGAGAAFVFTLEAVDCSDCDGNGIPDGAEIAADPSLDCDGNGVLDACQIDADSDAPGGPWFCDASSGDCDPDCNANGVIDACEIADGSSNDDDGNGVPDECEDCNGNGVPDALDIADAPSLDCDGDGTIDECQIEADASLDCNGDLVIDDCQAGDPDVDCDGNGLVDACEILDDPGLDCDGNGLIDACEIAADPGLDAGGAGCAPDGVLDACQDCDGDGVTDACAIAQGAVDLDGNGIPDLPCQDCDANGVPDFLQVNPNTDCDGDGVLDVCTLADDPASDCDGDGTIDACQIADDPGLDADGNGVLDACEDCNGNGVPDGIDIAGGVLEDCDEDGIGDSCAIADGTVSDCNQNGVPDACDIADGTSTDCDGDGIPDGCQADCNGNGIGDGCDIAGGFSDDFNGNGVPDECDPDCNGNLIPDDLDLLFGIAQDCNANGVPDSCDVDPADPDGNGEVSADGNGDGVPDECSAGDLDGDGVVGFDDVLLLITAWGDCPAPPAECVGDLDGNGVVGFQDLLVILEAWTT